MDEPQDITQEQGERGSRLLRGPYADWALGLISFVESALAPIITDPFIVMAVLAEPKRWFRYSLIASVASVLGGIAGYALGALFFELIGARLIEIYHLQEEFAQTVALFDASVFWVVLIGAVTPLPYKLVAIVGGFLYANFALFVLASLIGRSARFFAVGYITYRFGRPMLNAFFKRVNVTAAALAIGIALYLLLVLV